MFINYLEANPANVYTINIKEALEGFKISIVDTNAKTIVINNTFLESEINIKLNYLKAATITFPTSIIWKDSVSPVFIAGKTYFIYLITEDMGKTYQGIWIGSW